MANQKWSKDLMKLVRKLNNFVFLETSSKKTSTLFCVAGKKVGILTQKVAKELSKYEDVFEVCPSDITYNQDCIKLRDKYETFADRTKALDLVVNDMKKRDAHISLRGWRNEDYNVAASPTDEPLLKLERAAVSIFGIKAYGSHMNGFVNHPEKGICLWIAKRSKRKQTFPGMYDNMVAGGIGRGIGIYETMVKECEEEAGIPESLAKKVVPVGMISYLYEDERGVQQDVQYCFDLEIPLNFRPTAFDGEVEEFKLYTIEEVKNLIVDNNFKPNSAGITLDFLIRKGFVSPDEVPDYVEIIQLLHYQF